MDNTPDLDAVGHLSGDLLNTLTTDLNVLDKPVDELEMLQYDGLEHLAGYICHKIKSPDLVVDSSVVNTSRDSSFTWTNQLAEGGLQKPTEELMGKMESLEKIFKQFNGDKIVYSPNYVQQLVLLSEEIICQKKVKEIFFRSRMYFRIKADFTYAACAPRYYDPHFLIK